VDRRMLDDEVGLDRETDRMFGKLLLAQWLFAIVLALLISPWITFGAVITSLPLVLIRERLARTKAIVEREVQERIEQQRQLELELRQAQQLESVDRLATGVAHEINTPLQFISDSVEFVRGSVGDLISVVRQQQAALEGVLANRADPLAIAAAVDASASADLPYLADEMPRALDRATDGLDRVSRIVRSMKVFAHSRGEEPSVDLDAAIDSTLAIANPIDSRQEAAA
jgi:two-component system, NtrC family, sensor kinase